MWDEVGDGFRKGVDDGYGAENGNIMGLVAGVCYDTHVDEKYKSFFDSVSSTNWTVIVM
jgi:hypothetical protein